MNSPFLSPPSPPPIQMAQGSPQSNDPRENWEIGGKLFTLIQNESWRTHNQLLNYLRSFSIHKNFVKFFKKCFNTTSPFSDRSNSDAKLAFSRFILASKLLACDHVNPLFIWMINWFNPKILERIIIINV